jgi:hypothetical protein
LTQWSANFAATRSVCRVQVEVAAALEVLGVKFEADSVVEDGLVRLDFRLLRQKAAVEVVGPTHFTVNKPFGQPQPLGRTVLRLEVWLTCCALHWRRQCTGGLWTPRASIATFCILAFGPVPIGDVDRAVGRRGSGGMGTLGHLGLTLCARGFLAGWVGMVVQTGGE